MELFTVVPTEAKTPKITHDSRIVSVGSCFAENIADKLAYHGFNTLVNPFGILFHPLAIAKFLESVSKGAGFSEADIVEYNGWHCLDAHSGLSSNTAEALIEKLNSAVKTSNTALKVATHVIVTLGTAFAYKYLKTGSLVANCHKIPQKEFEKTLLSPDEIYGGILKISEVMRKLNPNATLIFTISPVRHIKDGFVGNQRSKSHLFAGLHAAIDKLPLINYFPSYEIMIDELRDYRYYQRDMIHPNETAIDYIWQWFADAWISPDAQPLMDEIDSVRKAKSHRAFNPDSEAHLEFLQRVEHRAEAVRLRLPHIVF